MYYQAICAKGHYYEFDPFNDTIIDNERCYCRADAAWDNKVLEDDAFQLYGLIPLNLLKEKFLVSERILETCNLGHEHVVQQEIFRIPTQEETDAFRTK